MTPTSTQNVTAAVRRIAAGCAIFAAVAVSAGAARGQSGAAAGQRAGSGGGASGASAVGGGRGGPTSKPVAPPVSLDIDPDYLPPLRMSEKFDLLNSRSMFAKNGRAVGVRVETGPRNPGPPILTPEENAVFVGVLRQDDQYVALIENRTARNTTAVHVGEALADGKVQAITLEGLTYAGADGKPRLIEIGQAMTGQAPREYSGGSSYASGSSGSSSSSGSSPSPSSSTSAPSGSSGASNPVTLPPGGAESIAEQMRRRRAAQLGGGGQ